MRLSLGLVLAAALVSTTQAFVPAAPLSQRLMSAPSRGASSVGGQGEQQAGRAAPWSRLMAMKDVGVGIIGAGRIGIVHLEALASW